MRSCPVFHLKTGRHLLPQASEVRSNNQTWRPWSFQSLGHQSKLLRNIHKAAERCRVAVQGCIWRKINQQRIPREREILIKCRKNRWWGNAMERRETQVWREYSQRPYKVKTHGPQFTRTCPSHRYRVVPTHSPRGVWGNLTVLVLLGSFGSIKIAAGNNWWCPLMKNG